MSILIDSVTPHTPAAKAGIRDGDRLVAVNGNLIHDVLDYRFYMIDTSWMASAAALLSAFSASSISCPAACGKPSTLRMTTAA